MNLQELKDVIANGESEQIDFKVSFGKEVIETLCAFANHKGGVVPEAFSRKPLGSSLHS